MSNYQKKYLVAALSALWRQPHILRQVHTRPAASSAAAAAALGVSKWKVEKRWSLVPSRQKQRAEGSANGPRIQTAPAGGHPLLPTLACSSSRGQRALPGPGAVPDQRPASAARDPAPPPLLLHPPRHHGTWQVAAGASWSSSLAQLATKLDIPRMQKRIRCGTQKGPKPHRSALLPRSCAAAALPPPRPPRPPRPAPPRPAPRPRLCRCVSFHLLRAASFSLKSMAAQCCRLRLGGSGECGRQSACGGQAGCARAESQLGSDYAQFQALSALEKQAMGRRGVERRRRCVDAWLDKGRCRGTESASYTHRRIGRWASSRPANG